MATRTTAAVPACLVGFVDNDDITTNKVYLKHNLISCTHSTHLSNCQTCSKLENSLHPCCSILPLECLLGVVSQGHHRHRTDEPRGHNFSGLHEPRPQCQGHRTGSSRRKRVSFELLFARDHNPARDEETSAADDTAWNPFSRSRLSERRKKAPRVQILELPFSERL